MTYELVLAILEMAVQIMEIFRDLENNIGGTDPFEEFNDIVNSSFQKT